MPLAQNTHPRLPDLDPAGIGKSPNCPISQTAELAPAVSAKRNTSGDDADIVRGVVGKTLTLYLAKEKQVWRVHDGYP
jgi:hypothetical protein